MPLTKHEQKLNELARQFKAQGMDIDAIADSLYEQHKTILLSCNLDYRKEFNLSNGLSEFARPEKSLWRICEIAESVE